MKVADGIAMICIAFEGIGVPANQYHEAVNHVGATSVAPGPLTRYANPHDSL